MFGGSWGRNSSSHAIPQSLRGIFGARCHFFYRLFSYSELLLRRSVLPEAVFSFRVEVLMTGKEWWVACTEDDGKGLRPTAMESVARVVRLASEGDGIEELADPEEKSVGMMPKTARFGCYALCRCA
ncbi:hypothetical protein TNCT_711631 [Trichonephila clavata]|uniref:Uncharacterized protein n=1 Tax=Trichonephila clavata TaxID=2740835 RepID=A0A8X6FE82_TRICU|nr:hypothetical protein TNCT_711631 [Trichonephila clavata]